MNDSWVKHHEAVINEIRAEEVKALKLGLPVIKAGGEERVVSREDILTMGGRQLDALVAELADGYVWTQEPPFRGRLVPDNGIPDFLSESGPISHVRRYSSS